MLRFKCSKISNTFLFLVTNKMLIIMDGIKKNACQNRIANTEDPDWFASSDLYGPAHVILVHIPYLCKSLLRG